MDLIVFNIEIIVYCKVSKETERFFESQAHAVGWSGTFVAADTLRLTLAEELDEKLYGVLPSKELEIELTQLKVYLNLHPDFHGTVCLFSGVEEE